MKFYPPEDRPRWRAALRVWNSYQMHVQGITYRDQGRLAWDGQSVGATAIHEFLTCSDLLRAARQRQRGK